MMNQVEGLLSKWTAHWNVECLVVDFYSDLVAWGRVVETYAFYWCPDVSEEGARRLSGMGLRCMSASDWKRLRETFDRSVSPKVTSAPERSNKLEVVLVTWYANGTWRRHAWFSMSREVLLDKGVEENAVLFFRFLAAVGDMVRPGTTFAETYYGRQLSSLRLLDEDERSRTAKTPQAH